MTDARSLLWVVTTGNKGTVFGVFTDPIAVARFLTDKVSPHPRVVSRYVDGLGLKHVKHVSEKEFLATV